MCQEWVAWFFDHSVHTYTTHRPVLELTQPPIQRVPGALSLRLKRPWCEDYRSLPSSAEVKNTQSYTSTSQYIFMERCYIRHKSVFMAWCLIKHRDSFTFCTHTHTYIYIYICLHIKDWYKRRLHTYIHTYVRTYMSARLDVASDEKLLGPSVIL
jgi:hypothetical protein